MDIPQIPVSEMTTRLGVKGTGALAVCPTLGLVAVCGTFSSSSRKVALFQSTDTGFTCIHTSRNICGHPRTLAFTPPHQGRPVLLLVGDCVKNRVHAVAVPSLAPVGDVYMSSTKSLPGPRLKSRPLQPGSDASAWERYKWHRDEYKNLYEQGLLFDLEPIGLAAHGPHVAVSVHGNARRDCGVRLFHGHMYEWVCVRTITVGLALGVGFSADGAMVAVADGHSVRMYPVQQGGGGRVAIPCEGAHLAQHCPGGGWMIAAHKRPMKFYSTLHHTRLAAGVTFSCQGMGVLSDGRLVVLSDGVLWVYKSADHMSIFRTAWMTACVRARFFVAQNTDGWAPALPARKTDAPSVVPPG
jgi:hypothetical protein